MAAKRGVEGGVDIGVSQWADVACDCLTEDCTTGAAEGNRVGASSQGGRRASKGLAGECAALASRRS